MICRSEERGKAAQKEIIDQSNNNVNALVSALKIFSAFDSIFFKIL